MRESARADGRRRQVIWWPLAGESRAEACPTKTEQFVQARQATKNDGLPHSVRTGT
ncbi:hypothetical protein SBA4_2340018 [Candidatus Sulfopaludibacter sp. SbA4]|nr:hypothetical protein SBA4_2340018 [Candidatus Sulfopaludibacter sp. SbA4]